MLVGQPELGEMLNRADLRQLRQRIALRHHLRPFDAREVDAYIDERLGLAGYDGKGIFKRSARREIFAASGGVPRLVNVICDGALLAGFARGQASLDADVIEEVARDLCLPHPDGERVDGEQVDGQKAANDDGAPEPRRAGRRRWLGLFG